MDNTKLVGIIKNLADAKQAEEVKLGVRMDALKLKRAQLKIEATALEELASKIATDFAVAKK